MKNFIFSWLISLGLVLAIDAVWLLSMVPLFYKPLVGHIFTGGFQYYSALLFYALHAFGMSYLVIVPNWEAGSSFICSLLGGLVLGLVAYGAYDLTNQATIKDWPIVVTVVDMLWGATLTGLTCFFTHQIVRNWST